MKNLIICLAVLTLSSCAKSPYIGSNPEAISARINTAGDMLDSSGPDGCSFNKYKDAFECDEGIDPSKINKRVLRARESLIEYLRSDPYIRDTDRLGFIILSDLYYCRDNNGMMPHTNSAVFYCETELPSYYAEEAKKIGRTLQVSRYNEMYKYVLL